MLCEKAPSVVTARPVPGHPAALATPHHDYSRSGPPTTLADHLNVARALQSIFAWPGHPAPVPT
eukprot:5099809-Pyramimonas_sp.AAC.1